jgi:hypothetical protein
LWIRIHDLNPDPPFLSNEPGAKCVLERQTPVLESLVATPRFET